MIISCALFLALSLSLFIPLCKKGSLLYHTTPSSIANPLAQKPAPRRRLRPNGATWQLVSFLFSPPNCFLPSSLHPVCIACPLPSFVCLLLQTVGRCCTGAGRFWSKPPAHDANDGLCHCCDDCSSVWFAYPPTLSARSGNLCVYVCLCVLFLPFTKAGSETWFAILSIYCHRGSTGPSSSAATPFAHMLMTRWANNCSGVQFYNAYTDTTIAACAVCRCNCAQVVKCIYFRNRCAVLF